MAQKATIYSVRFEVADLDCASFETYDLTIARHPSETPERLMIRILAFGLHAHDDLRMTRGLSADDEPDLWQVALDGTIEAWIEVGQPDLRRIKKAIGRAKTVFVYSYGKNIDVWQKKVSTYSAGNNRVVLRTLHYESAAALGDFAQQRTMHLNFTHQEERIWLEGGGKNLEITCR